MQVNHTEAIVDASSRDVLPIALQLSIGCIRLQEGSFPDQQTLSDVYGIVILSFFLWNRTRGSSHGWNRFYK